MSIKYPKIQFTIILKLHEGERLHKELTGKNSFCKWRWKREAFCLQPLCLKRSSYKLTELLHSSRTWFSWDISISKEIGTTAEVKCIKIKFNFVTAAYKALKPSEALLYCLFPGKLDSGNQEMFRSSWGWTTPATQAEFDFAWLARDWVSNPSPHSGRPRRNTLLGDWAGVKAVTNGHPSCNSKLPETTPENLNLSQALQFTLREVFLIFNLHSIMSYQRGACNHPKITELQYNTFSKSSMLTAGKKKGKKKENVRKEISSSHFSKQDIARMRQSSYHPINKLSKVS